MKQVKRRKARVFVLVLFTNIIGEKTGHVYPSMKAARVFKYPEKEIIKVREVMPKKRKP